jgi:hypothetical protein
VKLLHRTKQKLARSLYRMRGKRSLEKKKETKVRGNYN